VRARVATRTRDLEDLLYKVELPALFLEHPIGIAMHAAPNEPWIRSLSGVYRTVAETDLADHAWSRTGTGPDKYPEFGQCVHKTGRHPSRPERL